MLPAKKNGDLGFLLLSTIGHIRQFLLLHSVLGEMAEDRPRFQGLFSPLGWPDYYTHDQTKNDELITSGSEGVLRRERGQHG